MKRIFILAVIMAMVLVFSMQAQAALTNLGTDSLGNRLIYDSDLDITWYDYTNSWDTWQNQVNWADALSVTFGSNTYTDWRLPTTVDGPYVWGYDGTTTAGYCFLMPFSHIVCTGNANRLWPNGTGSVPR